MWRYDQSTGNLYQDGRFIARGYSGWDDGDGVREPGEGKNDPGAEAKRGIGPIPRGRWRIGAAFDHPRLGRLCLPLAPLPATVTHGRSGFLIHGDSMRAPGTASHGCIIVPRAVREQIAASADRELDVVERLFEEVA